MNLAHLLEQGDCRIARHDNEEIEASGRDLPLAIGAPGPFVRRGDFFEGSYLAW